MRLSCGVDLVEIDRVAAVIGRWGDRFLTRVFTDAERAYCRGRVPELAVRFAAKEAVSKALGTGIVGMAWRD
ncbi:MAG: holo-[acyl-carrier-protein] synthase, partial [Chloroflexi bacterium]